MRYLVYFLSFEVGICYGLVAFDLNRSFSSFLPTS